MKILVLIMTILALNGCITKATPSLDPLDNVSMEDARSESDDTRNKRSGDIFSTLLNKKLKILGSLSSGKSFGHSPGHYEEPLSYHTKSFNLWGVKKAIMSSVFQAAKAITGGVIALKGQLIKAKGHAVVTKGKIMQTKGEAISNFGKNIATHAFDSHDDYHDASGPGLYNHLPVVPIHQPTSYGATALAYQAQAYPNNAYQTSAAAHGYQAVPSYQAAPSYQFGVPHTGYGGSAEYSGYGGGGYTAKRAVPNSQDLSNKHSSEKDSVQAGLLIFKPIKMSQNSAQSGGSLQQMFSDQRLPKFPTSAEFPTGSGGFSSSFPGFQGQATGFPAQSSGFPAQATGFPAQATGFAAQSNGFPAQSNGFSAQSTVFQGQSAGFKGQSNGLQGQAIGFPGFQDNGNGYLTTQLNGGYPKAQTGGSTAYQFPGGSSDQISSGLGYAFQNFNGQPQTASQEFAQQVQYGSGQASLSQESYTDQSNAASDSDEHVAQATYKNAVRVEKPATTNDKPERFSSTNLFFTPTAPPSRDDDDSNAFSKKLLHQRSAPKKESGADDALPNIVPLKRVNDSDSVDQAKLKQTIQRFFNMLPKHRFSPSVDKK